ncbi:MAG: ATP-binding protein [Longimicrobiales bacterium]|nr:ATP-binding protein [Longimicrobiales bacterium]
MCDDLRRRGPRRARHPTELRDLRLNTPTPLRRELLLAFSVLLGAALLLATSALVVVLPLLRTPTESFLFIVVLIAADLVVVAAFGRRILHGAFVRPVERMVEDAERIASGDYTHRIGAMPGAELEAIRQSVNALADRLVRDQVRLAENVRSLDRTNAELVSTRDELIQTARLASIGTLASGIAHEVGNPLGALVGYVDVARMRAEREGGDPELLASIREEADRIDRIIRTLLQFARGNGEATAGPVRMHEVVERVLDLLESQGRLAGVEVRVPEHGPVPDISGHPQQVEQILVNLLLNALDALEEVEEPRLEITLSCEAGGFIRMPRRRDDDPSVVDYTHRRRVATDLDVGGPDALHTSSRVVVLTVEDNGPGVSPEHLDRLFDPFFTTKEPGKGTGLGLAICARLADGMGGRIHLEEASGGGACFVVRLPTHTGSEVS